MACHGKVATFKNTGNTCFAAAALQAMFPSFPAESTAGCTCGTCVVCALRRSFLGWQAGSKGASLNQWQPWLTHVGLDWGLHRALLVEKVLCALRDGRVPQTKMQLPCTSGACPLRSRLDCLCAGPPCIIRKSCRTRLPLRNLRSEGRGCRSAMTASNLVCVLKRT